MTVDILEEKCIFIQYESKTADKNPFTGKPVDEIHRYSTNAQKAFKKLAISMCVNHDSSNHSCILKDRPCRMMKCESGKVCDYFRKSILPLDPILEAKLNDRAVEKKKCAICGTLFEVAGRQIYCSESCKQKGARIKDREKKKKQREKAASNVPI